MAAREDMGSWLDGGPSEPGSGRDGVGLGLPSAGPGALAGLGRRLAALAVDWALSLVISAGFFGGDPMATLGVFAVENVLLVGTAGYTVGHRLLRLRVRTHVPPGARVHDGGVLLPGPVRAVVRTLLLCLVIPAVVTGEDGRPLHDRAAGTVVVRR